MILFHGTSSKYLGKILNDGLKPRSRTKSPSNWDTVPSHKNHVYLTDAYAPYFAECALQPDDNFVPVVLIVETLRCSQLVADEDAVEQVHRHMTLKFGCSKEEIYARTAKFRSQVKRMAKSGEFNCDDSLRALGTCAHIGTIPREAIVGYVKLKRGFSWAIWDPTINLLNYSICSKMYRHASELLWAEHSSIELNPFDKLRYKDDRLLKTINSMVINRVNTWIPETVIHKLDSSVVSQTVN